MKKTYLTIAELVFDLRKQGVDVTVSLDRSTADDKPMIVCYHWEMETLEVVSSKGTRRTETQRNIAKSFYVREDLLNSEECIAYLRAMLKPERYNVPTDLNEMYYDVAL